MSARARMQARGRGRAVWTRNRGREVVCVFSLYLTARFDLIA